VIKKVVLYLVIFVISLMVSLLALFPANILWQRVLAPQTNLDALGVRVEKVQGTIWEGKALINYRSIVSILSWEVQGTGLLGLTLPVDLNLVSQAGELQSTVSIGLKTVDALIVSAEIQLAALNPVLKQQKLALDGVLLVKDLELQLENLRPVKADGMASWSGGDIAYPAGREVHQRNLPMFRANIETKEGEIRLAIRDAQASFDVISASLDEKGVGMMSITRRLLDLSREPWSQNSREQDVVFKVKKELF